MRQRLLRAVLCGLVLATGAVAATAAPAGAATFTVTVTEDSDDGVCDTHCSLREAVAAANATPELDTISLPADATFEITGNLFITAPTALQANGSTVTGPGTGGVLVLESPGIEVADLGQVSAADGLRLADGADASVTRSDVATLESGRDSTYVLADSSINHIRAGVAGSVIEADGTTIDVLELGSASTATVVRSTVGRVNPLVAITATASIVGTACNEWTVISGGGYNLLDPSCAADASATDVLASQDLVRQPQVTPPLDHGGPTPSRNPWVGSQVLDAIPAGHPLCSSADQRGVARPQGPGCDIGSVEATDPTDTFTYQVSGALTAYGQSTPVDETLTTDRYVLTYRHGPFGTVDGLGGTVANSLNFGPGAHNNLTGLGRNEPAAVTLQPFWIFPFTFGQLQFSGSIDHANGFYFGGFAGRPDGVDLSGIALLVGNSPISGPIPILAQLDLSITILSE